jgi:hypothetical protein
MLLDLSRNTILVALVLLNTASVCQSRYVEDANLGEWSLIPATLTNGGTYL